MQGEMNRIQRRRKERETAIAHVFRSPNVSGDMKLPFTVISYLARKVSI